MPGVEKEMRRSDMAVSPWRPVKSDQRIYVVQAGKSLEVVDNGVWKHVEEQNTRGLRTWREYSHG